MGTDAGSDPGGGPERPQLGPYRLLERIGSGGMGEVFLAERHGPVGFKKQVVVKRLLPHRELDSDALGSFLDEARLTAQLVHPNVIQVLELGQAGRQFYIAMEYLPGASVRGLLAALGRANEPLPAALAGWLCAQALHGLHHAHELTGEDGRLLGLVHRDVSPENLLVGLSGNVKVVDFGLAKAFLAPEARRSGTVRGKVAYMPPEQLQGKALDRRADVYAVGCVLFELLAGRPPFEERPELAADVLSSVPSPPDLASGSLEHGLLAVALRALEKRPEARFASAREMAEALEQALQRHGVFVGPTQLGQLLTRLVDAGHLPKQGGSGSAPLGPGLAETGALPAAQATVSERGSGSGRRTASQERKRIAVWVGLGVLVTAGLALWALGVARRSPVADADESALARGAAADSASAAGAAAEHGSGSATGLIPSTPGPTLVAPPPPAPSPRESASSSPARTGPTSRDASTRKRSAKPGHVVLRAHPWAEVFLDGRSLGTTPMAAIELPPGQYTFVFKNASLGTERRVQGTVRPGGRSVVKANLLPAP